jgi:hypothetical protein
MANANDATAQVRLSSERRDQWDEHADELTNGNRSDFIKSMVEAGRKKFDADVSPDEPTDEIRRERNRLRRENEELREENERLYDRLDTAGTRGAIVSYLREHGDATFDRLIEHVSGGVTERVNDHIDAMRSDGELGVTTAPEPSIEDGMQTGTGGTGEYEPGEPVFYLTDGDGEPENEPEGNGKRDAALSEGFDEIAERFDPERMDAIHLHAHHAHEARKRENDR